MKTEEEQGGYAFTTAAIGLDGGHILQEGMTLRDWFAGMALQGMLSYHGTEINKEDVPTLCNEMYEVSDAMLEARKK